MATTQSEETIERKELTPFERMNEEVDEISTTVTEEEIVEEKPVKEEEEEKPVKEEEEEEEKPVKEEEVEEEEEEEEEVETSFEGNPNTLFAEYYKDLGLLPEDFEIKEDLKPTDVGNALKEAWREELKTEVRAEERQILEEEGLTEDMISKVKQHYQGVPLKDLSEVDTLKAYSSYEFDDKSEEYLGLAKAYLTDFYISKEFSEEQVARYVDRDIEDVETLPAVLSEAKSYFGKEASNLEQRNEDLANQNRLDRADKIKKSREKTETLLDTRKIDNKQYTEDQIKAVKKALFDKTEVIVVDGKKQVVTPYHKKVLETRGNFEKNLRRKIDFVLGLDPSEDIDEVTLRATRKLMRKVGKTGKIELGKKKVKRQGSKEVETPTGIHATEIS